MDTKLKLTAGLVCFTLPFSLFAVDTLYCPQNHGYISLGMTPDEVTAACGRPLSIELSKQPLMEKVPVQQFIYSYMGTREVNYGWYQLHTGFSGTSLQVNIIDNKVKSIQVNGSNSNMASFCDGPSIQVGDEAGKVYGSCGAPSVINNTYINQPVQTATKPIIWTYQPVNYQPSVTLTFVDGQLQSIN